MNEINEECRRTSEVLGLSPRKVNINRSVGEKMVKWLNKQDIIIHFGDAEYFMVNGHTYRGSIKTIKDSTQSNMLCVVCFLFT